MINTLPPHDHRAYNDRLQSFFALKDQTNPTPHEANQVVPTQHPRERKISEQHCIEEKLRKQRICANKKVNQGPDLAQSHLRFVSGMYDPCYSCCNHDGIGVAFHQGLRPYMEDRFMVAKGLLHRSPYRLAAVFDGHGGSHIAELLTKSFQPALEKAFHDLAASVRENEISSDYLIFNALKLACTACDAEFKGAQYSAGSTAIFSLSIDGDLWIGCVGDSRAILCKNNGKAEQLSEDGHAQSSSLDQESTDSYKSSVHKRGGFIERRSSTFRINGMLHPARAFGNARLVSTSDSPTFVVSARPKITKIPASEIKADDFLILCSDGLTAVGSSASIRNVARLAPKQTPAGIAEHLIQTALGANADDNITVMVIPLKPRP